VDLGRQKGKTCGKKADVLRVKSRRWCRLREKPRKWMELEITMLSEISQAQKARGHMVFVTFVEP
jgi:hypothetical protein